VVHSHQEQAMLGNDILSELIQQMIGADFAALSKLELDGDARVSGNVITNGATDALDFVKEYLEK